MKKKEQIIAWLNEIEAAMPERPKNLKEFEKGQTIYNNYGSKYTVTSYVDGILRARTEHGDRLDKFKQEADGLFYFSNSRNWSRISYRFYDSEEASDTLSIISRSNRLIDDVYKLIEKSELVKP